MTRAAEPSATPRRRAATARPELRMRMRVTLGEMNAIGPGKVALLEAVDEHRSISAAAKSLGMSYRRAWVLIDELNRSLKSPAVTTAAGGANGGGTMLTEVGHRLVQLYRGIEEQAEQTCRAEISQLLALVAR
jgi:molybdate transport system regulatory protein